MTWTPALQDMRATLTDVVDLERLLSCEAFAHVDADTVFGLLEEAGRWCQEVVAETNRDGDTIGSNLVDGGVVVPPSFKAAYEQYVQAGFGAISHPTELGGGGFPVTIANAFKEMLTAANMAFSLGPLLTTGAVEALVQHGSDDQKAQWGPKLVTGEWSGTMCLTEPHAGSNVGAVSTKATPQDDGSWKIQGQKIFITYGDHDMADQIVHFVLARAPGAPEGTKGISLYLVPKFLPDADGNPGEENDVTVVGVEHKMGIHGSPTCTLAFGEKSDGATGWLIGELNEGMKYMFVMMNDARLGVGIQGLSIAQRAYQDALQYAKEREQGRAPDTDASGQSPIIEHPDVMRMLLTMRATIAAMRRMVYRNAEALDLGRNHGDAAVADFEQKLGDLLVPLSKAWCTDMGVEMTSLAIQVYGGMGYIEETGVAQHFRDARIAPIYEGTNGIQALDLIGRKLRTDDGAFIRELLDLVESDVTDFKATGDAADMVDQMRAAILEVLPAVKRATEHQLSSDMPNKMAGATPYLRILSLALGSWLLGQGAVAAAEKGDMGTVHSGFFFATQLLPEVHGLVPQVLASVDALMSAEESTLLV